MTDWPAIPEPAGRLIEFSVPVLEGAEYIPALRALFEHHGGGSAVETLFRGPEDGAAFDTPRTVVRTWLPEEDAEARARVEEGLWRLTREHDLPAAAVRPLAQANWAEAWKEHYAPLLIGPFWVTPAWHDVAEAPAGTHIVRLDPGMAFGTGQHPTTRLCLGCLAGEVTSETRVLDVGTGSGVLAIAAARLGAPSIVGIDIDPAAIRSARENADLNDVHLELIVGSMDVLGGAALAESGSEPHRPFEIVLANLLAHTIHALADDLAAWTAKGGVLIASGILVDQVTEISEALAGVGFVERRVAIDGDWAAIVADRTG